MTAGCSHVWHRAGTQALQDEHGFNFCFPLELSGFCYLHVQCESKQVSPFCIVCLGKYGLEIGELREVV